MGSETILVVEDEDYVRTVTVSVLETLGYNVLDAASGALALQTAAAYEETIHLLMSDVIMPKMNGPELAALLKAERPNLSVLFASGYSEDFVSDRGVMSDHIHFIPKPYTIDQLARKIRSVLAE